MSEIQAPDIVRAAYAELIVTNLAASRWFWVDMLGFVISAEQDDALYLRGHDELTHHSPILRTGVRPAAAAIAYRVRSAADLDRAQAFFSERGCACGAGRPAPRPVSEKRYEWWTPSVSRSSSSTPSTAPNA